MYVFKNIVFETDDVECRHSNGGLFTCEDKPKVNAQVSNGGKVPKKPGGCNCHHIPKVLEHLTGLPNL